MGDKYKIMRPAHSEHPELTGRQMGHKYKNHAARALRASRAQVGDKCEIMRPEHSEHPELAGRQVGNK